MIEEAPLPSHTPRGAASDAERDSMKFTFDEDPPPGACIKVVGIGGGGCNAVNRMIDAKIAGVQFIAVNTDAQALRLSRTPAKLQLGAKLTQGYGAGSDREIGRNAALEDTERLVELLDGADMVFVTVGLGGGTGTGAAPVIASLAKEMGALTIAAATKPFSFEGARRMKIAQRGLDELAETVDTVVTVPNEHLLAHVDRGASFFESFRIADDILLRAVQGISDIITIPGTINCDFADIRAVMCGMGHAVMGTAVRSGENAALEAARAAVSSPLLENADIDGAQGILINVTGSAHLGLHEVHEAAMIVQKNANENANIIFGAVADDSMGENVKVTVIATGFRNCKPDSRTETEESAADHSAETERDIRAAAWQAPADALRADAADAPPDSAAQPETPAPALLPTDAADAERPDEQPPPRPAEELFSRVGETETPPVEEEDIHRPAFFRRRFGR